MLLEVCYSMSWVKIYVVLLDWALQVELSVAMPFHCLRQFVHRRQGRQGRNYSLFRWCEMRWPGSVVGDYLVFAFCWGALCCSGHFSTFTCVKVYVQPCFRFHLYQGPCCSNEAIFRTIWCFARGFVGYDESFVLAGVCWRGVIVKNEGPGQLQCPSSSLNVDEVGSLCMEISIRSLIVLSVDIWLAPSTTPRSEKFSE